MELNIVLLLLFIVPIILVFFVQRKFQKIFFTWKNKISNQTNKTGAQIAIEMLRAHNINDVRVVMGNHMFSDAYDPSCKVIILEPEIYNGNSVTAHAVACHECGHAVQHALNYNFVVARNKVLPFALVANKVLWIAFFISIFSIFLISGPFSWFGISMIMLYVVLACLVVIGVFQLITLPVELDASKRAVTYLEKTQILSGANLNGAKQVLKAAAWTYVVAFLTTLMFILRLVIILFSSRR